MGKAQVHQAVLVPGIAGVPKHQVTTCCRVIFNRSETLNSALTSTASVLSPAVVCGTYTINSRKGRAALRGCVNWTAKAPCWKQKQPLEKQ